MQDNTAYEFRAILKRLGRNPVLIAMTVTSLIFGATASIAGIAIWRASSACIARMSAPPNVAQVVTDVSNRGDLLMHEALQADLGLGVGPPTHGDSALPRKVASAACPCATSIKWHWQRI